ncbi:hypothetical protein ACHAW5_008512 [Stephanodiscus triporus]|uniref:Uncharacterized protein n=1 Tax=Stephanodiscus triporus TaxID=2934178 RepID=A0ABD3N4R5_9STRA
MTAIKDRGKGIAATPLKPADRVLQGLLDRYMGTLDDTIKSESLAMSTRSYFLARVAERRYASEVSSFNRVIEKYDENGIEEAKEPGSPPQYGRAIYQRSMGGRGEKHKHVAIYVDGASLAPVEKVNDRQSTTERYARGRQSLRGNKNRRRSLSSTNGVNSMKMPAPQSRQSLGSNEKNACSSSNNSVNTSSNHTTLTKASQVPPRARSLPSLVNMKPVLDHDKVQRLPSQSSISQRQSNTSKAIPAVPKAPTTTTYSTTLQRSAGVYRRDKRINSSGATPKSVMELKSTPSFEALGLLDSKHNNFPFGESFDDDISVAASLFSMASISDALSAEDTGIKSLQQRRGKAILNLKDVRSGRIQSKVPKKKKCCDDQSVASTATDTTSLLYTVSQSMSEESTLKLPMKQEIHAGSNRADRRRQRSVYATRFASKSTSSPSDTVDG